MSGGPKQRFDEKWGALPKNGRDHRCEKFLSALHLSDGESESQRHHIIIIYVHIQDCRN